MTPAPIGGAEFSALMDRVGPFAADRRVMAAVSGGADSMALALLLSRWGRPLACIVDHGLRPDSAGEAAQAASRLARLGILSRTLQAGLIPGAGIAARARRVRYDLLTQACIEADCADLLVAHHARDQAETLRLRQAGGSGAAGLAGMAAVSHRDAIRLLRPLLGMAPERLRATLALEGVAWAEDPSNQDLRTPRARLRQSMAPAEVESLHAAADRHGRARQHLDRSVAAELAAVDLHPEGYAVVHQPLGPAALSSLVWCLSGRDHPPASAGLAAGMRPRSLHGVVIGRAGRLGPGWLLAREPAAMALPVPAEPGARWDGRFVLSAGPAGARLGALGEDAARFRSAGGLPSAVLRTLPALRRGAELYAVPHLHFPDAETCRSLGLRFAPSHAAAGAPFCAGVGWAGVGWG